MFLTKEVIMNGIGRPAAWFDKNVVNALVNFSGNSTIGVANKIKKLQSGKVQMYGMVYLFTVIVSVLIIMYFINRN
jgi:NADH-quinone oxidoreductase subunit L